jgi:hypothetical protein
MPNWMLCCPDCQKAFVHSQVVTVAGILDPWIIEPKPEFPDGGVSSFVRTARRHPYISAINSLTLRVPEAVSSVLISMIWVDGLQFGREV